MSDVEEVDETEESPRRSRVPLVVLGIALLALVGVIAWVMTGSSISPGTTLPEGVSIIQAPDLASASTTTPGTPVQGIGCVTLSQEQVVLHTHTIILIYDHGTELRLPAGVGITTPWIVEHYSGGDFVDVGMSDCLYWVHTHAADGIVHVEAPQRGTFTLGELFAIWRQPLGPNDVGPARGPVTTFVNGKAISGDPAEIVLKDGATIQLDVGTPTIPGAIVKYHVKGGCGSGTLSCSSKQN